LLSASCYLEKAVLERGRGLHKHSNHFKPLMSKKMQKKLMLIPAHTESCVSDRPYQSQPCARIWAAPLAIGVVAMVAKESDSRPANHCIRSEWNK